MRIEQITGAGMQQTASVQQGKVVETPVLPNSREVYVTVGQESVKIGEYVDEPKVDIQESVENMNKELKQMQTNLRFSIHQKTNQIMVKIVDTNTKQVIKEIPSEKILDMVAAMMEKAGLILDKRG